MADPINYMLPQQSFGQQFVEMTAPMMYAQQNQLQQQLMQQKALAAQQAAENEARKQAAVQRFVALGNRRTSDDVLELSTFLPKDQMDNVLKTWEGMGKERQANELSYGSQIASALQNGATDAALSLVTQRAEAAKNAGDNATFMQQKALEASIRKDPQAAYFGLLTTMSALPEGKNAVESILKVKMQPLEQQKLEAELIPPSIREAISYDKQPPNVQRAFMAIKQMARPVTQVNLNSVDKNADAAIGGMLPDVMAQAQSADEMIGNIARYRKILPSAITGPTAKIAIPAAQLGQVFGFKTGESLAATREMIIGLAEMTLSARGALKGQGAITEGEGKLLADAKSGRIDYTKEELETLFRVAERAAKAQKRKNVAFLVAAKAKGSNAADLLLSQIKQDEQQSEPAAEPAQQNRQITVDY